MHMLFKCRVARSLFQVERLQVIDQSSDFLHLIERVVFKDAGDPTNNLVFFLGWRIWRMRNKENNRELIVQLLKQL